VACKELEETSYWLELLTEANIFPEAKLKSLLTEANELLAILVTVVKMLRRGTNYSSFILPTSSFINTGI
jgi:four helix bundle protein